MGIATLVGFDSAANTAEEANDPFRSVPSRDRGIRRPAATVGVVFVLASPPETVAAALIAIGVVLVGVDLVYLFIASREVLETEPDTTEVFKHWGTVSSKPMCDNHFGANTAEVDSGPIDFTREQTRTRTMAARRTRFPVWWRKHRRCPRIGIILIAVGLALTRRRNRGPR